MWDDGCTCKMLLFLGEKALKTTTCYVHLHNIKEKNVGWLHMQNALKFVFRREGVKDNNMSCITSKKRMWDGFALLWFWIPLSSSILSCQNPVRSQHGGISPGFQYIFLLGQTTHVCFFFIEDFLHFMFEFSLWFHL